MVDFRPAITFQDRSLDVLSKISTPDVQLNQTPTQALKDNTASFELKPKALCTKSSESRELTPPL